MAKVIITVKDGLVQEVFCNDENICVEVLDFDTQDGDEAKELKERYDEVLNGKSYKDIL